MAAAELSLAGLLAPLPVDRFVERHWERKHLVVPAGDRGRFAPVLSWQGFDSCLRAAQRSDRYTVVQVPPKGGQGQRRKLRGGEIAERGLYQKFSSGCTLVVNHAHELWPPIGALAGAIAEALSASVAANLYLTPAATQGFGVHYDNHDVFIAQVEGSKQWLIYDRACELPLNPDAAGRLLDLELEPGDAAAQPLLEEVRLDPGDLLYLPRGFAHEAVATDEASLHITFGVYPWHWSDLVKAAVEVASLDDPGLRRGLPPGFVTNGGSGESMSAAFARLLRGLAERHDGILEPALEGLAQRRLRHQEFPADGHFEQLGALDGLDDDTRLTRRAGISVRSFEADGKAHLVFGPHELRGPLGLAPAFGHVQSHASFQPRDLPGLDGDARRVLVRRLVREGLLRIDRG